MYNDPKNLFVAQFIGSPSMNLFEVSYESTGDDGGRLVGDVDIEVGPERARRIEAAGAERLKLGIRPEHVGVSQRRDDSHVAASVDIIEPLGARDLLYFELGEEADDGSLVTGDAAALEDEQTAPEAEVDERKAFIEPESISEDATDVFLSLDLEQADIFDAETGTNVAHLTREETPPTA